MSHLIPGVDSLAPGPGLAPELAYLLSLSHADWCQAQALSLAYRDQSVYSGVCVTPGLQPGQWGQNNGGSGATLRQTLAESPKLDDNIHFSTQVKWTPLPSSVCHFGLV